MAETFKVFVGLYKDIHPVYVDLGEVKNEDFREILEKKVKADFKQNYGVQTENKRS